MAEDTQGTTVPVSEPQDAPMPSADQQTPVSEGQGMDAPQEVSTPKAEDTALPESAAERTRREFDKLKEQLRQERTRREYVESVFQSMQPKQPEPQITPIIDPDTGLPREDVLTDIQRRALEAEQRAKNAESQVQSYLQEQENRATYAVYPELDPQGPTFNKDLHRRTRSFILDSMLNPDDYGGKQLSFKEAADLAKGVDTKAITAAKQAGAQQAIEQLSPKEQAALEAVGNPSRRAEALSNLEELRRRSRQPGDEGTLAVIERLKALPKQE